MAFIHEIRSEQAQRERVAKSAWRNHLLGCETCGILRNRVPNPEATSCRPGHALLLVWHEDRFALQRALVATDSDVELFA